MPHWPLARAPCLVFGADVVIDALADDWHTAPLAVPLVEGSDAPAEPRHFHVAMGALGVAILLGVVNAFTPAAANAAHMTPLKERRPEVEDEEKRGLRDR